VLPPESLGTAMAAGLRYVAMSPSISLVLVRGAMFGLAAIAVQALMPLIARDLVHGGPLTFGLLLGAFGAGAVCGALLAARLRRSLSIEAIVRLGFIGFAVCVIGAGLSSSAVLTMVAMVFGGASWVVSLSSFNVTVQLSAPRWVVGRALALYQMATFGGMACGSWIWGVLAERYGVSEALLIAGGVLITGAAFGLRYALPELTSLDLDPLGRWREPEVTLDIRPRSGPIVVTIEYLIREQDVADFLAVMAQRRRVRRRDGARHWTLLRDLENPELWVERYHTPTWLEYVRHNQRRTQADAAIGERLLALHKGPEEPRVHRMIERPTGWITPDAASAARDTAGPLADTASPS
jgi:hypothetical protein